LIQEVAEESTSVILKKIIMNKIIILIREIRLLIISVIFLLIFLKLLY